MCSAWAQRSGATTRAHAALELAGHDYKDTALQARQILALSQAVAGAPKQATALAEAAVGEASELKLPRAPTRTIARRWTSR